MSIINDRLKQKLNDKADTDSVSAQMSEAKSIRLLISEDELKFIIVLIENISKLTQSGLLDLTDAERASADKLYQTTLDAAKKYLDGPNNSYINQIELLKKKVNLG